MLQLFKHFFARRKSVYEVLEEVAKRLPLKEGRFRRYPSALVSGDYFGFQLTLEGGPKKGASGKGFRFLATVTLPQLLNTRVFLAHETRKTSLRPVASLKLVTTYHARFNQNFLLLSDDPEKTKAVFQPYLCGKIVSLSVNDWQCDAGGDEAHLEIWQKELDAARLCEVLQVVIESLNALLLSSEIAKNEGRHKG